MSEKEFRNKLARIEESYEIGPRRNDQGNLTNATTERRVTMTHMLNGGLVYVDRATPAGRKPVPGTVRTYTGTADDGRKLAQEMWEEQTALL